MSLGEFYTPRWLAGLVLDGSGYDGDAGRRLCDPACGQGVFLELAIERARSRGAGLEQILSSIQGMEMNPLAAAAARQAYRAALGPLGAHLDPEQIPITCCDSLLDPAVAGQFDFVVGNPPWVRWDYLPAEWRTATLPLWKHYGLFSLSGFEGRLGGGKKDLSMLFTYVAADRFLKPGGVLAFVITLEVLKSKGAGEGFRRFRLGAAGEPLEVVAVHDFMKLRPFRNAANKTAVLVLRKGSETKFPVPYYVWEPDAAGGLKRRVLEARPLGGRLGPWQTIGPAEERLAELAGENPYRPVIGLNANPYGVFWLHIAGISQAGLAQVRNLPELGKLAIPKVEAELEPGCLYPALRGSDIRRWRATPSIYVLLAQDLFRRRGMPIDEMRRRFPKALSYLEHFRQTLLERALYRKYHQASGRPFYSQFNAGPELLAPYKVVWRRLGRDILAAVASSQDSLLGRRLILPLETTTFIGTETAIEAHYLCAVLNSPPVRAFVRSASLAGRGFGSPGALKNLYIPKFDSRNPRHTALAVLSEQMHDNPQAEADAKLEELAWRLYG